MSTFVAVFEKGVLRPLEEIDLKEGERVRVEVSSADQTGAAEPSPEDAAETDDFLAGIRFDSGLGDLAERFDDYRFGLKKP